MWTYVGEKMVQFWRKIDYPGEKIFHPGEKIFHQGRCSDNFYSGEKNVHPGEKKVFWTVP